MNVKQEYEALIQWQQITGDTSSSTLTRLRELENKLEQTAKKQSYANNTTQRYAKQAKTKAVTFLKKTEKTDETTTHQKEQKPCSLTERATDQTRTHQRRNK